MFISQAFAEGSASLVKSTTESNLMSFLPLILMFAVLYFIMIRPQIKRQKEHRAMLASVAKGDEVVVSGGLVGKITQVNDPYLSLEIADNVNVTVQKSAVTLTLPKGTIKAL